MDSAIRFCVLALLPVLAACASPSPLPGPDSPGTAPVRSAAAGPEALAIALSATPVAKPAYMHQHVTPIRIELRNIGSAPLRIAYEDLALVDAEGHYFAALPLFPLGVAIARREPLPAPAFRAEQFTVAAAYARLYPTLPPYGGPFARDPQYHQRYYSEWASIPVPTEEMLRLGVPEGVLGPGGSLRGLVYFEYAAQAGRGVRLRADFVNPFTGERLGTAAVSVRTGS